MSSPSETRKPADTPFKQQRLWAWQPILSPRWVISCFFFIAAAFIPLGALVTVASNDVLEYEVRYDESFSDCPWVKSTADGSLDPCTTGCQGALWNEDTCGTEQCGMVGGLGQYCPRTFNNDVVYSPEMLANLSSCDPKCSKNVTINITETLKPPVYLYYKLTSFYQNHRRYAKSKSDTQLSGSKSVGSDNEECPPLNEPGSLQDCDVDLGKECKNVEIVNCKKDAATGKYLTPTGTCYDETPTARTTVDELTYSPCGLIAWSMFNDSFKLSKASSNEVICDGAAGDTDMCQKTGIAWDADVDEKFKEPGINDENTIFTRNGFATQMQSCIDNGAECNTWSANDTMPILPYLFSGWYFFEPYHKIPQTVDQDFMVWMRTASLPTFRKLYRKIIKGTGPNGEVEAGEYTVLVDHRFDTAGFSGEKYIVLTTLTWIGGKNYFLGITYITIGCLCVILACTFAVKHMFFRTNRQEAMQSYASGR